MRHPNWRSFAIGRVVAILLLALALATPASAQFGALKKKLKGDAAAKAAEKTGESASGDTAKASNTPSKAGAAGGAGGGQIVLTPETVDRLIVGLKAGKAEREKASAEDNAYGRYKKDVANYQKALAAYDAAQAKCQAAQQSFPSRMAANEKLMNKYQYYAQKMADAMGKDNNAYQAYADSALAVMDPSCTVKRPEGPPKQPDDYYDAQAAIDERAEQAAMKAADFSSRQELGYASDKTIAILQGQASDASPSEKEAVAAKHGELESLLNLRPAQEERVSKQGQGQASNAPPTATAPAPTAPAAPTVNVNQCMAKNVEAHQAEIDALGKRGEAAQKAGNTALMMAIADSIRQIQYAGCNRDQ